MLKRIILSLAVITLAACSTQDDQYYRMHPQELQKALKNCSGHSSCSELKSIASEVNQLAYELQMSPQGFGSKIIALQTRRAKEETLAQKKPQSVKLQNTIKALDQELAMRLAIVKWLESPGSNE